MSFSKSVSKQLDPLLNPSARSYRAIILDFGGFLSTWSRQSKPAIPEKLLQQMMSSSIWGNFERGRMSRDECYSKLCERYGADPKDLDDCLHEARKTLVYDPGLVTTVRSLKEKHGLSVFAMSNIGHEDYTYVRDLAQGVDWEVFDKIFPSYLTGSRKPDHRFYQYVIIDTMHNLHPTEFIYVDDKIENVIAARSFGMHGILHRSQEQTIQTIRNLIYDPIERAFSFLSNHAGHHESCTDTGTVILENFSQFLILDVTGDKSLITTSKRENIINFFRGKAQLTTEAYPADLDTTAVALTADKEIEIEGVQSTMDEMLKYRNEDGLIQVYFDAERPRVDPVVCVNVLSLFYAHGRGAELSATLEWVRMVLVNRAYLDGTRYYKSGEAFLYFFSRFLASLHSDVAHTHDEYRDILAERLVERIGSPGDSLELAMRVLACASLGIHDETDLLRLHERQGPDGGWEDGWFYRYGVSGICIGNKGLTTAFAMSAFKAVNSLPKP